MGVFLYKWSDGFQTMDPNRFDLPAGTFTVTICDTQNPGCVDEVIVVLGDNNPNCNASITLNSTTVSVSSCMGSDATIGFTTDFPAGCTGPSTTQIEDLFGNVVSNGSLPAGNFCVVLRDGNNSIVASECFVVVNHLKRHFQTDLQFEL